MARSESLRQEIDAMSGIERIMTALPPRTRYRVVGWVIDQFSEPVAPLPEFQANGGRGGASTLDAPAIDVAV